MASAMETVLFLTLALTGCSVKRRCIKSPIKIRHVTLSARVAASVDVLTCSGTPNARRFQREHGFRHQSTRKRRQRFQIWNCRFCRRGRRTCRCRCTEPRRYATSLREERCVSQNAASLTALRASVCRRGGIFRQNAQIFFRLRTK